MQTKWTNVPTAEWAAVLPFCNRIFQKHEINACCRSAEAPRFDPKTASTSLTDILENIGTDAVRRGAFARWSDRPLEELAGFILEHLHRPLIVHLTNIDTLIGMVDESHARDAGIIVKQLKNTFAGFRLELERHLSLEDDVLFACIGLNEGLLSPKFINVLRYQHNCLALKIKAVFFSAGQVTQMTDACEGCRALFATLKRVETILLDHIYLENNLLFPRASSQPQTNVQRI
jgi:regulator of cell morphogenesis and NO signaling